MQFWFEIRLSDSFNGFLERSTKFVKEMYDYDIFCDNTKSRHEVLLF